MSIGFSYGLAAPKRKKTCGKILLSSVIFANTGVCFPRSPRETGACAMTGGVVSSARAAAPQKRSTAAAVAEQMECMIHIRAHLARGRKTQRRPKLQSIAPPYLAAAGGGWWSRAPPDNGRRSPVRIVIDGNSLKLEQIAQAAAGGAHVEIAPAARERVRAARRLGDRIAESG